MHPAYLRLLNCAREATAGAPKPIHDTTDLWRALGATSATLSNWKRRGVPIEVAVKAQELWGCSAIYIREGTAPQWIAGQSSDGVNNVHPISGVRLVNVAHSGKNYRRLPVVAWGRLGVVLLDGVREADIEGYLDAADVQVDGAVWAISEVDYPRFGVRRGRKLLFVPVSSPAECTDSECYLFKSAKGALFLAEFRSLSDEHFEAIPDSGPSFDSGRHAIQVLGALRQIVW